MFSDQFDTMHRVARVEARPNFRVYVVFDDGMSGEIDLSGLVGKGVFAAWRDAHAFASVTVHPLTRTLTWPDGIDLDPDALYRDVLRDGQCPNMAT